MANGYTDGLPSVLPRQEGPTPYQNGRAGAAIAEGVDKLGRGITQAATFYDDSVANEQFNEYQRSVSTLMRGDPQKQSPGPDGSTVTDTGYLGLNGKAAMEARPTIEQQLDKLEKAFAEKIKSPVALRTFQQAAGRYRLQTTEQISSHASAQSDVWFKETAAASAALARDRIAVEPENPDTFKSAAAQLINNYVKIAQLNGAQPGDAAYSEAVSNGKRDALAAQVAAIGVANPKRAIEILEKNKAIAGDKYDELYSPLRARATEATGIAAANRAWQDAHVTATAINEAHIANPAQPIYQQAVTAVPGGYSATGLARLIQIESAGDPNAVSPSKRHVGLAQFDEATAREVGLTDRNDPKQSILAAQRLAAKRGAYLKSFLDRQPTDAELYLAHQQGPGGAHVLLSNPDMNAVDALAMVYKGPNARRTALRAVVGNGGKANMTSAEFVAMWAHRFNKTTPANAPMAEAPQVSRPPQTQRQPAPGDSAAPAQADIAAPSPLEPPATPEPIDPDMVPRLGAEYAPADAKADAYDRIFNDPDLNDDEKQAAVTALNQRFAVDKIRQDEVARVKKENADKALNDYTTKILTGQTEGIADQIAMDPNLEPASKMALINAMQADADRTVAGATAAYGGSYFKVLNQVLADPGDPSRITDNVDILRMASDPASGLTMQGAQKIIGIMGQAQKNPDQAAAATSYNSMLRYAKAKLSFQREPSFPGDPGTPDPQGEELFNARFIPKFDAAYNAWIEAKKDPWDFLNQENVDKLMSGLRNPREMAMQELLARSAGVDASVLESPPPPEGVTDVDAWKLVINSPPQIGDKPPNPAKWNAAITALIERPTPERIVQFDAFFGSTGVTATDILAALGVVSRETTEQDAEQDRLRYRPEMAAPKPQAASPFAAPVAPGPW